MIGPKEKRPEFSAVVAAVPVSSVAARVVSRGVHWSPAMRENETFVRSEAPLPTRPFSPISDASGNIAGQKFGDLRVIGLWRDQKSKKGGASWVVRCVCGYYEIRKARTLKTGARLWCSHCDYVKELKAGRVRPKTLQQVVGRE